MYYYRRLFQVLVLLILYGDPTVISIQHSENKNKQTCKNSSKIKKFRKFQKFSYTTLFYYPTLISINQKESIMGPGKNNNLNNKSNLGKSLQRRKKHDTYTSTRHSTDIEQHQTISSITEQTSLDDFLTNAEASRRNFEAERGQAAIAGLGVVPEGQEHDPHFDEDIDEIEVDETEFCSIPKKPKYDSDDTAETFKQKEVDSFLKWKRSLSRLQAKNPSVINQIFHFIE